MIGRTNSASGGSIDSGIIEVKSANIPSVTCKLGNTYNKTQTLKNGVTRFAIKASGTYTLTTIYNGVTITQNVTVTSPTQFISVVFEPIPTGSTVTPTDDIQTWLNCANIWEKSYTTLAEVLADTTTLLNLISNNNASDYMSRSTSWATSTVGNSNAMTYIGNDDYCATKLMSNTTWLNAICDSAHFEKVLNVKVPTMTSNTSPSGTCFSSGMYNNEQSEFQVFNNSESVYPILRGVVGSYIGYTFPTAMVCKKVKLVQTGGMAINGYKIQGSNNGSTWVDLGSKDTNGAGTTTINFTNTASYSRLRAYITSRYNSRENDTRIAILQFYGRR